MREYLTRLYNASESLTQEQIDACAWVMGASGAGWTRETLLQELNECNNIEYARSVSA